MGWSPVHVPNLTVHQGQSWPIHQHLAQVLGNIEGSGHVLKYDDLLGAVQRIQAYLQDPTFPKAQNLILTVKVDFSYTKKVLTLLS